LSDPLSPNDDASATPRPPARDGLGGRLVANTAANFVGQAALFALAFFATPFIVHRMGAELYGILVLLMTYTGIFTLLELGMSAGLVKYLAELLPQRRLEEAGRYFGAALTLFLGVTGAVVIPVVLSSEYLVAEFLNLSMSVREPARLGLLIANGALVFHLLGQVFASVPIASQRFGIVNAISVGTEVLKVLGMVAVLVVGPSLPALALVLLLVAVVRFTALVITARRLVPGLSLLPRVSRPYLGAMLHFSKYVVVSTASSRLIDSVDKLVIGHFLPAAFVTFYSIPFVLAQRIGAIVRNVTTVVFPAASALSVESSSSRLKQLYVSSSKLVAAMAAFSSLALFVFSHELLLFWIGAEVAQRSAPILRLLSLGYLVNFLGRVPYSISQATGRPDIAAGFAASSAALNLALLLVLVPRYGIEGAAWGFLVTQLALTPLFVVRANRLVGVKLGSLMAAAYGPVAAALGPVLLLLWAARPLASSLVSLGAVVALGLLVYAGLVAMLVLDVRERGACLAFVELRSAPGGANRA
jgi:O-antigen/teichoic acid export membrane protein